MDSKPLVFIGSSAEGLPVAEALFAGLQSGCKPTLWTQDLFLPGKHPLEVLEEQIKNHSFAVLVASPDDFVVKRDHVASSIRDNILIEFGLFVGALGRRCVFFVYPSTPKFEVPSDVLGIVYAKYDAEIVRRKPNEVSDAVEVSCRQIKKTIDEEWRKHSEQKTAAHQRMRSSTKGQAVQRLHHVAIKLRDSLMMLQRDAFAALSDRRAFDDVKQRAAEKVSDIAKSFEEDALIVKVEEELAGLAQTTVTALLDLPFPRELAIGREAARRKAVDVGIGAFQDLLGGRDPMSRVHNVVTDEAKATAIGLKERYGEWWERHHSQLQQATSALQDALMLAALDLASTP